MHQQVSVEEGFETRDSFLEFPTQIHSRLASSDSQSYNVPFVCHRLTAIGQSQSDMTADHLVSKVDNHNESKHVCGPDMGPHMSLLSVRANTVSIHSPRIDQDRRSTDYATSAAGGGGCHRDFSCGNNHAFH